MKGQFFIIASVIIVFTLVGLVGYIHDFGSIDLTEIGRMGELKYIDYIKDVLNETSYSSYSSRDCNKLRKDLDSTNNFLKDELIKKGIVLDIDYQTSCPPPNPVIINFNFSIKTSKLETLTEFGVTVA